METPQYYVDALNLRIQELEDQNRTRYLIAQQLKEALRLACNGDQRKYINCVERAEKKLRDPDLGTGFDAFDKLRAENERLRAWLDPIMEAYNDFEDFDFTSKSASMELALRRAFVDWHEAYRPSNK